MGLFENLGRKVGRFTQEAKQAAADEAGYVCGDCGEQFYTAREACPECGSENVIERRTPTESNADAADADDVAESDDTTTGADDTDDVASDATETADATERE